MARWKLLCSPAAPSHWVVLVRCVGSVFRLARQRVACEDAMGLARSVPPPLHCPVNSVSGVAASTATDADAAQATMPMIESVRIADISQTSARSRQAKRRNAAKVRPPKTRARAAGARATVGTWICACSAETRRAAAAAAGPARAGGARNDARLHRQETFALHLLARELAGAADRFRLFPRFLFGGFLVMTAELHLAENAFALHLLLQRLEGLVDVVVANEYLHACSFVDAGSDQGVKGPKKPRKPPFESRGSSRNGLASPQLQDRKSTR